MTDLSEATSDRAMERVIMIHPPPQPRGGGDPQPNREEPRNRDEGARGALAPNAAPLRSSDTGRHQVPAPGEEIGAMFLFTRLFKLLNYYYYIL